MRKVRAVTDNTGVVAYDVRSGTSVLATVTGTPPATSTTVTGLACNAAFLPDDTSALVTERDSFRVFRLTTGGVKTQTGSVPNTVITDGEGGLLDVAVDPAWNSNHYVYFMHTAAEGNRIVRMTYDGSSLGGYTVLLQASRRTAITTAAACSSDRTDTSTPPPATLRTPTCGSRSSATTPSTS